MKTAYFDCFSGASGDMILGALVDAGCPPADLQAVVARLNLPSVTLSAAKINKQGIAATKVTVEVGPEARKKHRHLPQIEKIIDEAAQPREAEASNRPAALSLTAAARAKAVFRRLAEAEAFVHATTPEKVHFHEVGAADAIVDIVCACAAIELLGIESVRYSPVPVGSGTVLCEHGVMPVPAPATANLLKGVQLAASEEVGELTTPTGAALLVTLGRQEQFMPPDAIASIGYGAGTRDGKTRPNLLRVFIGEQAAVAGEAQDVVTVLEANIDDDSGQSLAHLCQMLLDGGALDVWMAPILMKKGRPGHLLSVLCERAGAERMEGIIFRETTTFGIRRHECGRAKLLREIVTTETAVGPIRVKIGRRAGRIVQAWPEYEDCAAAASASGRPLRTIQAEALAAWQNQSRPKAE